MNNRPYELQTLRYGECCVLIEFCANCNEHNSSLRHDEQKYYDKAVNMKSHIQNEFPFIKVYLRPLNTAVKESKKRLGLFEISFGTFESSGFMLMASKLKTMKWPEVRTVINNIRAQFKTKTITVDLISPESRNLHPKNQPLDGLNTYLVSAYDFPFFLEDVSKRKTASIRKAKTAKPNFKKERTLSSVVKRKIESGETKSEEIDDLLQSKEYIYKLKAENGSLEHNSISPGNFVLCVLEDCNFKLTTQQLYITPNIRDKDKHQHEKLELEVQEFGFLEMFIGFESENPAISISFKPKEYEAEGTENSYISLDNDLVQHDARLKDGRLVACYNSKHLQPGIYDLSVEYRDYTTFQTELVIYKGHNEYTLLFPELKLDVNVRAEKEMPVRQKAISPKTDMPIIIENPGGEDRFDATATKRNEDSGLFNAKENQATSNNDFEKENVNQNIKDSFTNKSQPRSEINQSNTSFESKSSKQVYEELYDKQIANKNRITSGNRIRPGERLTSAKSNNMAPVVHNDLTRDKEYITVFTNSIVNDIVWDSLDYEHDKFNIFIKENKTAELRLDFVLEDDDIENVISESKSSGFRHVVLGHSPKIKLVRLYLEKLKDSIDEKFDIYINNRGRTTKIEISEFLKHNTKKSEKYCDICILCNNTKSYNDFVLLVPLKSKIQNVSGLIELKNIISFVKNSKFDVFKFFGFEDAQNTENNDQAIGFKEAATNLNTYEIYCNDDYLLNSIRYHDKELVSMKKLEKIYPIWVDLVKATDDILDNLEEGEIEDEPFEPDEFDDSDFD